MDDQSFNSLYRLLRAIRFPRPTVNGAGMPSIAWPDSKTGIALPGEEVHEGWEVVRLDAGEMAAVGSLVSRLSLLHVDHSVRVSASSATRRTSKDEEALLAALLRIGLPEPDRNYSVRDDAGTFRGVPDFVWETVGGVAVNVAVEVDGWHWHVEQDMVEEIAILAARETAVGKKLQKTVRAKGAVDAAKRRVLIQRGWQVIVLHDTEITPATVDGLAKEIETAITFRLNVAGAAVGAGAGGDPEDEF